MSVPSSTNGEFADTTDTDSVASGDLYGYQGSSPAGTGTLVVNTISTVFTATGTTNTVKKFLQNGWTDNGASVTYYPYLVGTSANTTESVAQLKVHTAGTLQNLWGYVGNNSRTDSATTVGTRINGGNGNLSFSVPASTTGSFEDQFSVTGHSDTVAATNLINCISSNTSANSQTISVRSFGVDFITTANLWQLGNFNTGSYATSTTHYLAVGGSLASGGTVESAVNITARLTFTASYIGINVDTNTITSNSTAVLRQNGGNTALSVSIPGSTSGIFEDATDSVVLTATDKINYAVTTGASGTTLLFRGIWMLGATLVQATGLGSLNSFGPLSAAGLSDLFREPTSAFVGDDEGLTFSVSTGW